MFEFEQLVIEGGMHQLLLSSGEGAKIAIYSPFAPLSNPQRVAVRSFLAGESSELDLDVECRSGSLSIISAGGEVVFSICARQDADFDWIVEGDVPCPPGAMLGWLGPFQVSACINHLSQFLEYLLSVEE